MTNLVVLSAGLSQPSSSRLLADRLADATAGELRPEVTVEVIELRDHAHAIVDNLLTGFPSGELRSVIDKVVNADGLIAVTPTFSASYSGLFKSFFDVLAPKVLTGLPVLLGATGGTARHSLALDYAVRPLFGYLQASVVPTSVFAATADFGTPELHGRIERAAGELAALVKADRPHGIADPFDAELDFASLLGR